MDLFTAFKKNERETGQKLSEVQKIKVTEKIEHSSTRESEKILAEELAVDVKQPTSKTKKLVLDDKTYAELIKLAKNLDINSPADLIKLLVKEKSDEIKTEKQEVLIAPARIENEKSRYVPKQLKRTLLKNANYQCQFVSHTGRRCSERVHLEIDHHLVPFSQGGRTILSNLKIVCKNHNCYLAVSKLGQNQMKKYLYL